MLSSTTHRYISTNTVIIVITICLITLYNLRDIRAVSDDLLAQSLGDEEDSVKVTTNDTDKAISPSLHKLGNDQDIVKTPAEQAFPSAIATTLAVDVTIPSPIAAPNEPRRAFVTFLEGDTGTNHGDQTDGENLDDKDDYFVGMFKRPSKFKSSNSSLT